MELEDNLYLDKGVMAKATPNRLANIAHIARELGISPATPDEARKILGLKERTKICNFRPPGCA